MQLKREFDYYYNLRDIVTQALLHLLCYVADNARHVPTATRNKILIRYLKPKLLDKSLSNVKKDIKVMLSIARKPSGNLEMRLYELNEQAKKTRLFGVEKLYKLLEYLHDHEGIESRLFEEGTCPEEGIAYMISDHIEHGFDIYHQQVAPLSILLQSENAQGLVTVINQHGMFAAEMKEWNSNTYQAHILLHPHA